MPYYPDPRYQSGTPPHLPYSQSAPSYHDEYQNGRGGARPTSPYPTSNLQPQHEQYVQPRPATYNPAPPTWYQTGTADGYQPPPAHHQSEYQSTLSDQSRASSLQGPDYYRRVIPVYNGVQHPPPYSCYSTPSQESSCHYPPSSRDQTTGYWSEYGSHAGYCTPSERREEMHKERQSRQSPVPPTHQYSPLPDDREYEYRRMEEEKRGRRRIDYGRQQHTLHRLSEEESSGIGDISSGVDEKGRSEREVRRDDRGSEDRIIDYGGQSKRRQTVIPMESRADREISGRIEKEYQRYQGIGHRKEEGRDQRDLRDNGRRDDEGRTETIGRPRDEGHGFWNSHVIKFDNPKKRIRWQVITILKNVRDKNLEKAKQGQELQFELIEVDPLFHLIMMGCGNEMEFFEATQELNMSGDNLFFNFLRDMQGSGLCQIYKGKARNGKTGDLEDKVFVMDPEFPPPSSFDLTRF